MKVSAELYELIFWDDAEGFTMIEDGDWEVDYKWQNKRVIVQHDETRKYYALYRSRSGSPYSEYYYDDVETDRDGMAELEEVRPVTKTIIEYI